VNSDPSQPEKKLVIVLDNHRAHRTPFIKRLAKDFDFELLY